MLFIKLIVLAILTFTFFSCSEKRGFDKIKEGAKEVSEDVSDEAKKGKEDNEGKKIRVKFKT